MPRRKRLDALILGGGMAGISAALSLRGFGLDALILEEREKEAAAKAAAPAEEPAQLPAAE